MNKSTVIVLAILILIAGFAGGYFFRGWRLSRQRQSFSGQFQRTGNGNNAARLAGRPVVGEIISQDDKSITVKAADGSTKIIVLSDTTIYSKTATGTKDDLKVGTQVGVFGTENSDGSMTAQNVQLNPEFKGTTPTPTP